jgi:hypothetical protein
MQVPKFWVGSATDTLFNHHAPYLTKRGTMALFKVKTSKKVETNIKLEESTVKMLNQYAHFHQASADDVVDEALQYIFSHDKDFEKHLKDNPDAEVPSSVRVKKPVGAVKAAATPSNGNGNHAASSAPAATAPAK